MQRRSFERATPSHAIILLLDTLLWRFFHSQYYTFLRTLPHYDYHIRNVHTLYSISTHTYTPHIARARARPPPSPPSRPLRGERRRRRQTVDLYFVHREGMFATTTTTTTTHVARAHCASRSTSSTRATSVARATAVVTPAASGGVRLGASRQSAIARGGAIGATTRATQRHAGRRAVVTCVMIDARRTRTRTRR